MNNVSTFDPLPYLPLFKEHVQPYPRIVMSWCTLCAIVVTILFVCFLMAHAVIENAGLRSVTHHVVTHLHMLSVYRRSKGVGGFFFFKGFNVNPSPGWNLLHLFQVFSSLRVGLNNSTLYFSDEDIDRAAAGWKNQARNVMRQMMKKGSNDSQ